MNQFFIKIYFLFIAIFIISLFSSGCRLFRGITDPALRLYRRGSCISIDVPPITLTPAQTALERQLIGDDVELEENGWLIASAKSSKGHAQNQEISKAQAMYREIGILEYLEEDIQKYKKSGVIGESFNGELKILPPGIRASVDADEISKVSLIVQETNRARVNIYNYFLKSKDKNKGRAWTDKNYKYKYFNLVKSGEWKQNKNGSWEKIK